MSIQFQTTAYNSKVTILNDEKLALTGEPIEGNKPGRTPKLNFVIHGNNARCIVKLNNGKQDDEGRIVFPIDLPTMFNIIVALEDAVKAKEAMGTIIEVKRTGFDRTTNKPTDPYAYGWITIGKDSDGNEFIGVQRGKKESKHHVKVKFFFTHPEFHPVLDSNGQPVSRQRLSNIVARGYIKLLESMIPYINAHVYDFNTTPTGKWMLEQKAKNGNNYSNNNHNRNNDTNDNGGSYNSNNSSNNSSSSNDNPDSSFDDDFPF